MNTQYTIFCDADGVLMDFDKKIEEITGQHPSALSRGKLWSSVAHYNDTVQPFFLSLEKMADADQLWNYLKQTFANLHILTASGYTPKDGPEQKKASIAKNFGPNIICNVVPKSPDKAAFAGPNHILIDDREKSIIPWIQAGGIGVLHTSAANTIRKLKEILNGQPQGN